MISKLKAFFYLIYMGFATQIIYKKRIYFRVFQSLFSISVFVFVWIALDKYGLTHGQSISTLISYTLISNILSLMIPLNNISLLFETDIKKGDIANKLLRPLSLDALYIGDTIGATMFNFLTSAIPIIICGVILKAYPEDLSFIKVIVFLISLVLGVYIYILIDNIAGYLSFWIDHGTSIRHFFEAIMNVFSGKLIPLILMPEWFSEVAKLTPARLVYYDPISIYTGMMTSDEYNLFFLRLFIWIVILRMLLKKLKKAAVVKVFSQGG